MSPVIVFTLFALCSATPAKKTDVEPEYLDMLRATGQDEEFARLMGIDVSLVRPQEGRSEKDLIFTKVSDLGDILLAPEQEEQARQGLDKEKHPESIWPNNRIPYRIANYDFTRNEKKEITDSIESFNRRAKILKIVPREKETDYVYVINGNGCYSNLGKTGGRQILSLQRSGCLNPGTIPHEFIHAAGLTHEHNRSDRDDHVKVLFQNIPAEWHSQYEKGSSDDFGIQATYDYCSVMHYPMKAPGSSKPAFELLDSTINPECVGQRKRPTDLDIQKVDILYS